MRSFHTRIGHTTDRVTRDAEAEAYIGDDEMSRCASWLVEHDACFPDLQEIAGRVMHMWTFASPAARNWAEHERIHTAKRNKLEFRKVAQLVEIATNLKLLGCSERSGGYVLPWGHMATLDEAQPEEYTHPLVDDEDEEEPEPEEWGARPYARAEILLPYDYVPPPPAEPVQALEDQTDTEGGEDLPAGVDKSAKRLYYTYGGGADGFQPRCTAIRDNDDDSIPTTNIGLDRGQRDASGGASGVATGGTSGDALGGASGVLPSGEREREVIGVASVEDGDDDAPLVTRRAHLARQGAGPAAEGLRRSVRLQTLARSTSGGRHEVSDHLHNIRAEAQKPSQHTPTSAPRGYREQMELRTSDFQGLGLGFSSSGVRGRTDGRERVGDDRQYHPMEGGGAESTEELHARMDREEEQRLEQLQREWAGRVAYLAEPQRLRDLETGSAVPHAGGVEHNPDPPVTQEAVPMEGDLGELNGGRRPNAEGDDGVGDAGRLAPAHCAGLGDDEAGDDPAEVGGSMSLVLVLRDPSPVAHEVASQPVEGGGGVDEEGEGGTTHDHHDPVRADMEEGQITPVLLDPDALHSALVEDPFSKGPSGSHGVGVRSPPLYTPLSPLYSGSPASLEREQQRSESIRAAASGARTTPIPPIRPPPPTALHGTPPPVRGSIAGRGHMSSSSSPRLDTQQSDDNATS
ncbi:hypothetical protein CBR_g19387 [Chara braunii]|uniref:HAT C-terminal dimerisation domain-containing protein n=1 Tax=Chara braunii TaxID=69332 RepID=A0A388KXU2_CHABU|nr:hypothetical protein CBR_g19387 [Chara braunii]|eukprot:GBG74874.1 hypothetical protein CBR_g19387 [Chara braunii]